VPNFAKEPFRPSRSYFRQKEVLAIRINMNEKINTASA
jgi:hypothetical protein